MMCKKLICLISVLVLSFVCTSYADVVIGDFEGDMGNWVPGFNDSPVLAFSDIGVTSGAQSLALTVSPNGFNWALQWNAPEGFDLSNYHTVVADVTWVASEWAPQEGIWVQFQLMAVNSGGPSGWSQSTCIDPVNPDYPGSWDPTNWGDQTRTLSWDISGYDSTGTEWLQIIFATNNGNVTTNGTYYIDNVRLLGEEPAPELGPRIYYVDATEGETGNTMLATGEVFTSTEDGSGSDNLWRGRAFANSGTIFESGGQYGETVNTEDCPRLMTSVEVPENDYNVYVYFWSDGSPWRIRASMTNTEGEALPLFVGGGAPEGDPLPAAAIAEDFEEPVPLLTEGNRTLWQANIGTTGLTTNITVYIDDDPNHLTHNARTWYDGIGYQVVPPPAKPKIIFVTSVKDNDQDGVQDDISWYDWLTAEGYDVDFRPGNWIDPLDPNKIAELEAADLIIASRGMATGEYDGDETAKWNNLTTPIICTNAWMIRSNRWVWMNSTAANKDAGSPIMLVLEPDHPIFVDVPVDEDGLVEVLDPDVASGNTSFLNDILDPGNGTLLAQSLGIYNTAWIVEWPAGVEYYAGAGQIAGGPRLLFMAGTQDDPYLAPDGVNIAPVGVFNLNEAGQQLLRNALEYLLPAAPVTPTHLYTFEDGTAKDEIDSADGTLVGGAEIIDGAMVTTAQDQWMEMPGDVIAMNTYSEVTIEAWYIPTAGANTSWSMLAYFGDSVNGLGSNGFFITSARGDDKSRAAISIGDEASPWASESGADGPEIDDGLLHQMASTIDGVDITLYIDGVLIASTPLSAANQISGISQNYAYLAKGGYTGDPEWIGAIEQFAIYDVALSAKQIAADYAAGLIK
jgi:hypothetical protein